MHAGMPPECMRHACIRAATRRARGVFPTPLGQARASATAPERFAPAHVYQKLPCTEASSTIQAACRLAQACAPAARGRRQSETQSLATAHSPLHSLARPRGRCFVAVEGTGHRAPVLTSQMGCLCTDSRCTAHFLGADSHPQPPPACLGLCLCLVVRPLPPVRGKARASAGAESREGFHPRYLMHAVAGVDACRQEMHCWACPVGTCCAVHRARRRGPVHRRGRHGLPPARRQHEST